MNSFLALLPLLIIVFVSLAVLILEVFIKRENREYLAYISLSFLVICAFVCIQFWNKAYYYFNGNLMLDKFSLFFIFILLLSTGFVILLSMKYISLQDVNCGEFYALLLLALSGVIIMVSSRDLLVIILGMEVLSISSLQKPLSNISFWEVLPPLSCSTDWPSFMGLPIRPTFQQLFNTSARKIT